MAAGATGRGRLRASDADRERLLDTLKTAFVQGRLTKDELDTRAGQALGSRTYAELAAITADIPAGLIEPQPPPSKTARAQIRKPINGKVVACGSCMIILPVALGAAFLTYYGGFLVMFLFAFVGFTVSAQPCSSRR
jgi:hypothetical protein